MGGFGKVDSFGNVGGFGKVVLEMWVLLKRWVVLEMWVVVERWCWKLPIHNPQTIQKLSILHVKASNNSGLEAPKSRSGGVLEASMGVLGRLGSIWGV